MAEILKHAYDTLYCIRHTLRELPPQKRHSNEDIDESLTQQNYSLLHGRCQTAYEANRYRKELEQSIFKYNRKGIIKTIEIVIQKPADCEQEEAFFQTAYRYICSKILPMGELAVICATVHKDEHKYLKDQNGNFKLDEGGNKIDISKPHLHIIAVPAVPDKKHEAFEWKLSAHDLTSKSRLKMLHPGLQKACDDAGIHATVYQKKEGNSQVISLTAKQLKEITNKTGIVLQKSITIDELAELIKQNHDVKIKDALLQKKINAYEKQMSLLFDVLSSQDVTISDLKSEVQSREVKINDLQTKYEKANEYIQSMEKQPDIIHQHNETFDSSWGQTSKWGTINQTIDEEKIW